MGVFGDVYGVYVGGIVFGVVWGEYIGVVIRL